MVFRLDPDLASKAEISWWEFYHKRDWDKLKQAIIELRRQQFGINIGINTAKDFVNSCEQYIEFKRYHEKKDEQMAQESLRKARGYMESHYKGVIKSLTRE